MTKVTLQVMYSHSQKIRAGINLFKRQLHIIASSYLSQHIIIMPFKEENTINHKTFSNLANKHIICII